MRQSFLQWSIIGLIFLVAAILQSHLYLSWDVIWGMHNVSKLLSGGTYARDFFDISPPMIFFIYALPRVFIKCFHVDLALTVRLFTFFIALVSILLCDVICKKIFPEVKKKYVIYFMCVLAFVYLLIPASQLAQREHFLVLLVTPYLLLITLRLENKSISFWLRLFIGILAGIGFGIKPYFLIPLVLVELTAMIKSKKFFFFFRLETCVILNVLILYLVAVKVFTPTYFSVILPYAFQFYWHYAQQTMDTLLFNTFGLILFAALLVGNINYLLDFQKNLFLILIIATLGCTLTYLLAGQAWFYHVIPLYSYSIMILALSFVISFQMLTKVNNKKLIGSICLISTIAGLAAGIDILIIDTVARIYAEADLNLPINKMIVYVKANTPNKKLYAFTMHPAQNATVPYYAGVKSVSRFGNFWMLPTIFIKSNTMAANLIRKDVIEDFNRYHPDLVIVGIAPHKAYFGINSFNYLDFFNKDANFRSIWKQYRYTTTIGKYAFYKREHKE